MAQIHRTVADVFREADLTVLDNFTAEELSELSQAAKAVKKILDEAKSRHQRAISRFK